ncbi:ANK3, partial [Symbiodinium sp. KB8]
EHKYGLAELGLLLDRGLPPDTCPFGITPLLLAATIGHLTAAQFLFVRGASPHVLGGQPPMLPVEAAARHNHLRIVELLLENGSVAGRALHFAAAGGSTDVATFLLAKNCSADAVVSGLSPVAVALASKQHSMASLLLPHCTP